MKFLIACSRLSVTEDDRRSQRATRGISGPDPTRRLPAFFNPPLTESLEQAKCLRVCLPICNCICNHMGPRPIKD